MCGVLPGDSAMQTQLRALGYREVTTLAETLFGPAGTTLRGHEFHWSDMEMSAPHAWLYSQKDRRGNRQNVVPKIRMFSPAISISIFFPIPRPSNTGSKWFQGSFNYFFCHSHNVLRVFAGRIDGIKSCIS